MSQRVVILGGGVAGLAAGYYLSRSGYAVTVVEKAPVLGGLCASFESHGFTLDHGPHKLYSVVPGILDEIRAILGEDLLEHRKKQRVRLLGKYLNYPLSLGNLLPLLGPWRAGKLGLDYALAMARGLVNGSAPSSYEDYFIRRFGRGVYELVFEPLAWKVWGDPKRLAADLAKARVPSGGATEIILRLLKMKESSEDVDAPFFYYPKGGFGTLPQRLAREIRQSGGRVLTSARPEKLVIERGRVRAVEVEHAGSMLQHPCEILVSSIPIPSLAELVFPGDREVAEESRGLHFRNLCLVYLILKHERLLEDHWIFFPERRYPFNRLFEQKAMSDALGPRDKTAVCCDLTCDEDDETWTASDEALVERCRDALVELSLTTPDRVEAGFVRRVRGFYPVYSVDYLERLRRLYSRLQVATNLIPTGRLGMFNYNNSDHCLDMGLFIANQMKAGMAPRDIWNALEERVRTYRIVD